MNDPYKYFAAGMVAAIVFICGYALGQVNPPPGEVLAPAHRGTPSDLPRWACLELVRYRVHDLDAALQAEGQPFSHYSAVELRAALGPKLGACPR